MNGKKKERLAAFNRANILESAHTLFLAKGIAGTTMDDIAQEAGCSKATIYSYFESKEELVHYLFLEGMNVFQSAVRDNAENSKNFKDFYDRFCACMVSMHREQPIYYEGVAGEAIFDENAPPESIKNRMYRSGEAVVAAVEQYADKALDISPVDGLDDIILFLWLCILGIVEKSALKDSYIQHKLGKSRAEFLEYAFNKLFSLVDRC